MRSSSDQGNSLVRKTEQGARITPSALGPGGNMAQHEIRIDPSPPLGKEPSIGHNRWHPDIPPAVSCTPGDGVEIEARDTFDLQTRRRRSRRGLGLQGGRDPRGTAGGDGVHSAGSALGFCGTTFRIHTSCSGTSQTARSHPAGTSPRRRPRRFFATTGISVNRDGNDLLGEREGGGAQCAPQRDRPPRRRVRVHAGNRCTRSAAWRSNSRSATSSTSRPHRVGAVAPRGRRPLEAEG
jgi:hypothetical protein